jgi:hypothetical protein
LEDRFVRNLSGFALAGIAAAAIAGSAIAASSKTHIMNVPLPDGSVAHIHYVGDVAPTVTVEPRQLAAMDGAWQPMALPSFAGFDRMMQQMNRQMQQMARQSIGAPGMNVAAYANSPAGATSTSVVSYSNGASTCTRTTEVVSQGPGKPPKVTSNISGDCSAAVRASPPTARPSAAPIDHT